MTIETAIVPRQTKYCLAIELLMPVLGHTTNAELLEHLRSEYPELSATTIHRATARLVARGAIASAPQTQDGVMRYDSNTTPHDHFMCSSCGMLRDAYIKEKVTPILEAAIGDCHISGQLTVNGICKKCMKGGIAWRR